MSDSPPPGGAAPPDDARDELEMTDAALILRFGSGKQLPRWFWRAIIAVMVVFAAYQTGKTVVSKLSGLLIIVAIALFLSFAIEPAVNWLADRGWKRSQATLLAFFLLFVGSALFIFLMGDLVVTQVADLVDKSPAYVEDATRWVNTTFDTDITSDKLVDQLRSYQDDITKVATNVGGKVLTLTGTLLGTIFQLFTVALFSYYMTSQGPQLRRNVCSVLPERQQRTMLLLWELAIQKTGGWLYSRMLLAGCSAAFTWLFLAILGVPSPLALAIWVGLVSQFIPAIGTYLAGALPVLIALLNDPIDAIWVLGFIILYQQIENYLLSPKITAHAMDLHPAIAFGSALAGAAVLGPVGAIMALPFAGVIQAFVSSFLERHEVIDSHLTELQAIEQSEGESGLRQALKRLRIDNIGLDKVKGRRGGGTGEGGTEPPDQDTVPGRHD